MRVRMTDRRGPMARRGRPGRPPQDEVLPHQRLRGRSCLNRAALLAFMLSASALAGGPDYVRIPPGTFTMGCEPKYTCPEQMPPHEVTFARPFWMGRTEVTVAEFRRFVRATQYRTDAEKAGDRWTWSNPRAFKLAENQPVVYVSMNDAAAYCSWAGGRLPAESEWTYAFRAGGETIRGHLLWDTDGRYVWFRENSNASPQPVGRKLPNAWGLYDMEGNAWEWTRSEPGEKYPGMIRGGSWITCPLIEGKPGETRAPGAAPFTRVASSGAHIRDDVGFRCVKDQAPVGR